MLLSRTIELRSFSKWGFTLPGMSSLQRRCQYTFASRDHLQGQRIRTDREYSPSLSFVPHKSKTKRRRGSFFKQNRVLESATLPPSVRQHDVFLNPENNTLIFRRVAYGNGRTFDFPVPLQWLRDHCHCDKCVHPSTKQRLIETFYDIPADIKTSSVEEDSVGFKVLWIDGHESYYTKDWLTTPMDFGTKFTNRQGWVDPIFWTGESIKNDPPTVDFSDVMSSDEGLTNWLEKIKQYGFCYVDNTPVSPEETEKLIERIAYIRNTHYGGFWDFTSDLSKGDTAYTQLGIGPHTDNTYFSDPAGLQLFHLLSHTDGEGGTSGLVDGFAAARELQKQDPQAYDLLSTVKVYSHASGNADSSIQPYAAFPTLLHDDKMGALIQVRWNTTDRAQVDTPLNLMDEWYKAARKWSNILKEFEYQEQLRPGKALIFDNWRVLHARSAFTGKRRMCGGYVNRDDFISKWKMLKYGRDEVLKQVSAR
ncbi:trimethyllysine dioxygenase [Verruconis gallopava]|uniref:Trimethyllysine dioxygenase n=1 Tax=Verruconis gallopava TaxID=253628 RepID=A0A0D2A4D6_9PEZI|nr:trimethyllysine dioxygenase [Verruconis gallopava]KIW01648.1 trimethyllysine dioxygenase [Verruconis gallopava]